MTHTIPAYLSQTTPLPIPHFLGFPDYTPENIYDIIIPPDMVIEEGDTVNMSHIEGSMFSKQLKVVKILKRRMAKGDWSKQAIHKNPHFVRFTTK